MLHIARAFSLALAFCLAAASPAFAADIMFSNETDGAIYELWNYPGPDDSSGLLGSVGRESEMTIKASDLKDCERLVISQGPGFAYQFFVDEEMLRDAKTMIFSMEQLQSSGIHRYPLLYVEGGEEPHYLRAGIPFGLLTQSIAFGVTVDEFNEMRTPDCSATLDHDAFAVAFGDISWRIRHVATGELAEPGDHYILGLNMVATFNNSSLFTMFSSLQDMGARPVILGTMGENGMAFSKDAVSEGLPLAKGLAEDADDDEAWNAFMEQLGTIATEGDIHMEFSSETFLLEMQLCPSDNSVIFTIMRHEDAALG
ncbi:hypothetical protein LJC23_00610 [Desulfovibrio sp. OttesenSCG-928-I05]|nr:hypothetical protein [Desulfovibrio sp. OttesenSCG-928-I05]